ncbi:MAG: peptide chain release factor 2 [Patescibacteria group bacterium]|jgi:peptide chain release factor 2
MRELIDTLVDLQEKIARTWSILKLDQTGEKLKILEMAMSRSDFWNDPDLAKKKSQEHDELKKDLDRWSHIAQEVRDLIELAAAADHEEDRSLKSEITKRFEELNSQFQTLEFYIMLSGKYDESPAIVAIHAGTGGVDAQDWASMLLRMYVRFCERQGWVVKIVDKSMGNEAGIKSVTMEVAGRYAYGYLKAEAGVHRLVRISPFDAEKMRHTSFALVEVLPVLEEVSEVQIDDKDLRIDTSTSSGHGGQSVNTTYSAIRIVHIPTGITVSCQNERSQQQNKETAMKILKGKLHLRYLAEQQKEKRELRGAYQEAAWGNQVRSYVLQPYKMVKDHRTKHEVQDVDGVLDGSIMEFIESYLRTLKK